MDKRRDELTEKIEHWFNIHQTSGSKVTTDNAERKVRFYANQFKEHTGSYYIRAWGNTQ